jgi:hypothetical protein
LDAIRYFKIGARRAPSIYADFRRESSRRDL